MSDLKNCPFCGPAGIVNHAGGLVDGEPRYSVHCNRCGTIGPHEPTLALATAAWNARPGEDQAHAAGVAEGVRLALDAASRECGRFLVGDPNKGIPLRSPNCHEVVARIRTLSPEAIAKAAIARGEEG